MKTKGTRWTEAEERQVLRLVRLTGNLKGAVEAIGRGPKAYNRIYNGSASPEFKREIELARNDFMVSAGIRSLQRKRNRGAQQGKEHEAKHTFECSLCGDPIHKGDRVIHGGAFKQTRHPKCHANAMKAVKQGLEALKG